MGHICDFCNDDATTEYSVLCPKCKSSIDKILKVLKVKAVSTLYKPIKKEKKMKSVKTNHNTNEAHPTIPAKNEITIKETVKNESTIEDLNETLSKCAFCEFSFLDKEKISCVENKDPKTCGFQKK